MRINLINLIQKRWSMRIAKLKHPQAVTEIGMAVHHQKMKGAESGPGDIGIKALIQIVICPVIIEIVTVLGQKGERKDPLERKAVAAEDTQNISIEAGILRPDLDMIVRRNMEKPRERNGKRGIDMKLLFPYIPNLTIC